MLSEIEGDVHVAALAFERTLEEDNWPLELPSVPPLNKSYARARLHFKRVEGEREGAASHPGSPSGKRRSSSG